MSEVDGNINKKASSMAFIPYSGADMWQK